MGWVAMAGCSLHKDGGLTAGVSWEGADIPPLSKYWSTLSTLFDIFFFRQIPCVRRKRDAKSSEGTMSVHGGSQPVRGGARFCWAIATMDRRHRILDTV